MFLAYRVLTAAYTTVFFITIVILLLSDGVGNIMAFLTMWTYLLLALYFLSSAIVTLFHTVNSRRSQQLQLESLRFAKGDNAAENGIANAAFTKTDANNANPNGFVPESQLGNVMNNISAEITLAMKMTWLLGNIVQSFSIIVTVIYFTAVYPLIGHTNYVDINLHAVSSCLVLIDTCVTSRPVRLLHVIHPMIYGACYLIFSAIYWSFDHVNNVLYPGVLDWNYPGNVALWAVSLAVVVIPLLQLAYFGAYRLRLHFCNSASIN